MYPRAAIIDVESVSIFLRRMFGAGLSRDPVAEDRIFTPELAIFVCVLVGRSLEAVSLWRLDW